MADHARRPQDETAAGAAAAPHVCVLGGLRAWTADGRPVPPRAFRTAKTRHLLRLLALQADHPVPADVLVDALWPGVPRSRGRASLRTAASQLRRTFAGDHLVRVGDALRLCDVDVDAVRFRRAAEEALLDYDRGEFASGLRRAREALALHGGELAADEPYLPALQGPAAQLALQHHHLLVESASAALHLGHLREAATLAEQVLATQAVSERATATLMRALARLGEPAAALRVYEQCRRQLAQELGIEPSVELRTLHQDLLEERLAPRATDVLTGSATPALRADR